MTKLSIYNPPLYTKHRPKRYKPSKEKSILHEVHIYLRDGETSYTAGEVSIPLEEIEEIRVIDPDTDLTVVSYFFSTVGIIAGALVIVMVIVLLTKDSCPYVYTFNGETFIFEGETYSGAIFKGLERDDYMPLPHLKSVEGLCKVRISNELKERQYTNMVNLLVVSHPEGTKALADAAGMPRLIAQPILPVRAASETGKDCSAQLSATDRDVFMFDEETDSNNLYLTFEKPPLAQNGKLIMNLKNTLWGDFVYGEFSKKFGAAYMKWIDKQNQIPPEELPARNNRNDFKLVVSLKTADGWKDIEQLPPVGPLGSRDVVVPLTLPKSNMDKVEIRLSSSFMFWEIDYAAMDYSADTAMEVTTLLPYRAFGSNTPDSKAALSYSYDLYLQQLETGEVTEVHFQAPLPEPDRELSFFLHTSGYYNHVRDYTGLPDREALEPFRTHGYFNQYSRELYRQMVTDESLLTLKK